jgi:hypothetical protein
VHVGVPAFMAVWERLPYWWVLSPLVRGMPFGEAIASSAYSFWLRIRLPLSGRLRALEEWSGARK